MQHPNPDLMRRAIELSAEGGLKERTGGVFGAVVARKDTGEIVGEGFNSTRLMKSVLSGGMR